MSYISIPSDVFKERAQAYLDWYKNGGKEELEAERRAQVRSKADIKGTKGWFWWKRPMTPQECEAALNSYMKGDEWGLGGEFIVRMYMFRRDDDASDIASLVRTATGQYPIQVDTRLWNWIKSAPAKAPPA